MSAGITAAGSEVGVAVEIGFDSQPARIKTINNANMDNRFRLMTSAHIFARVQIRV